MRKVLLLLALAVVVSQVGAATVYWKGGFSNNSWSDVNNWKTASGTAGTVPVVGDNVYFSSSIMSGNQAINIDMNVDLGAGMIYGAANTGGSVTFNQGGNFTVKANTIKWISTGYGLSFNVPVDRSTANYLLIQLNNKDITFNAAVGSHDGGGSAIDKYIRTQYDTGSTGKVVFNAPTLNTNYIQFYTNLEMGDPRALPNIGAPTNSSSGRLVQAKDALTITNLSGVHTVLLGDLSATSYKLYTNGMAPGENGAGTLTIKDGSTPGGGSLNLGGSSKFELSALGGSQDKVVIDSAGKACSVVLGGTLDITNLGGLQAGDYTLFDMGTKGSWSGSFSAVNLPAGFTGVIKDNATSPGAVVLSVSVPEPATMGLLLIGGLGAMIRRRR